MSMIEARGISKRYDNVRALAPLNLRIEAGEVFGFLGPNGAGKSTTTKIFCGLIRPSEGRASIGGFDVVADAKRAQQLVGYVPERVPVYKAMTAREYLLLFARLSGVPRGERRDRVRSELARVGLVNVERKPVGKFSKGMVQRLGIARALLAKPKVLFLDEPSSGLDPTGRREIRTLIQTLAQEGRTVFLCSHDLAEVQAVCHRVGFLRNGELIHSQRIGEAAKVAKRRFRIEVAANAEQALEALKKAPNVVSVTREGAFLTVEAGPAATRVALGTAVHKAGVVALGVEESTASLEALYREYVEQGAGKGANP